MLLYANATTYIIHWALASGSSIATCSQGERHKIEVVCDFPAENHKVFSQACKVAKQGKS